MTNSVTLSDGIGTTIDFTNLGVSVSHLYNNPVIILPTPVTATPVGSTPVIGGNTKSINIGFVTNRFSVRFTFTDGVGTASPYNKSTNYEKLLFLSNDSTAINPKLFSINGLTMFVHIESFNITFSGGDKDLALNCTLNLITCANIKMTG